MKKVIISYVRVSTKEQLKGHSIEGQTEEIERYIKYEFGDVDIEIYSDKGRSAKTLNRKGIREVINRIETGNIHAVVVRSVDRLSRDVADTIFLEKLFKIKKVKLYTTYGEYDLKSARGRKRYLEDSVDSQYETDKLSERVLLSKHEMARQGKYPHGGKVPYGYTRDCDQYLYFVEKEIKIIKELFKLYAYEGQTEKEVSRHANEKYGLMLKPSNIRDFLTKPIYRGLIYTDNTEYKIIDPILTDEDISQLHNRRIIKGYSKHGYKYRNKIFINGKQAYHTTKKKSGNIHKYYFIEGYRYFNENEIDQMLKSHKLELFNQYNHKLTNQILSLAEEYVKCSLEEDELLEGLDEIRTKIFGNDNNQFKIEIDVDESRNYSYKILT